MYLELSEHTRTIPHWFHISFFARIHLSWHTTGDDRFWIVHDMFSVSVANNFVHCQTVSDYGYHTFGELARSIYCLLQKIKQGSSLPLVEQWDDYVLPKPSNFAAIAVGEFLAGTRVLAAVNKIGSSYLKREFQRGTRRFSEVFTTSVLSPVTARSKIGQGLSCFCPAIIIGGDNHAPLDLLGFLLDGLLDHGWVKGSEIEACRSDYQSFVQEQRQLARSSTRSHPDIGDVLSFCSSQAGFRARQHLIKVCIVTNMVKFRDRYVGKSDFQVFQLTALIVRGPVTCRGRFSFNLDPVTICEDEVYSAILCVQDFMRSPHFTQRNFFSDSGIAMLAESASISDMITHRAIFEPWSHVETTSRSQVVADVCGCVNEALDRRRVVKDSQEQWYAVGGIRPSSEDSTSRSGVRISNVVEEGRVEYVPVRVPSFFSPGPSNLRVSSGKSKKRTISRSPVKRRFEIACPHPASQQNRIVEYLSFSAVLDRQQSCKKSRRSERK